MNYSTILDKIFKNEAVIINKATKIPDREDYPEIKQICSDIQVLLITLKTRLITNPTDIYPTELRSVILNILHRYSMLELVNLYLVDKYFVLSLHRKNEIINATVIEIDKELNLNSLTHCLR